MVETGASEALSEPPLSVVETGASVPESVPGVDESPTDDASWFVAGPPSSDAAGVDDEEQASMHEAVRAKTVNEVLNDMGAGLEHLACRAVFLDVFSENERTHALSV